MDGEGETVVGGVAANEDAVAAPADEIGEAWATSEVDNGTGDGEEETDVVALDDIAKKAGDKRKLSYAYIAAISELIVIILRAFSFVEISMLQTQNGWSP